LNHLCSNFARSRDLIFLVVGGGSGKGGTIVFLGTW